MSKVMKKVKVTVNMTEKDFEMLERLAEEQGITKTDALRRAIATEQTIREAIGDKGKVVIEKPDKSRVQIVFPN